MIEMSTAIVELAAPLVGLTDAQVIFAVGRARRRADRAARDLAASAPALSGRIRYVRDIGDGMRRGLRLRPIDGRLAVQVVPRIMGRMTPTAAHAAGG